MLRFSNPSSIRAPLIWLGVAALLLSCGSKFTANGATGGQGGEGLVTETAGAAGEGPSGGASSEGGSSSGGDASGGASSAGTAGKPATGCDCPAGSYCQGGTKTCHLCSEFSLLDFGPPEKLASISQSQAGNERFPRAASAGTDLFYRAGLDGKPSIWYAPTQLNGVGRALFAALGADSGPLFAPGFSPPQNFFFDRVNATSSVREIMLGTWANGVLTGVSAAPAPVNGGTGDFSVAIAADVRRAYWMTTRNKSPTPDLVWAAFGANATMPATLNLDVQVGAGKKCPRLGDDATPWVNAAGTLLLFRSESMNESCQASDSGAFDLFVTPLGKDGQPLATGTPLTSLNTSGGSNETDPSLSQDSCTIYFASDSGKGEYDLYRAARN